MKTQVAAIVMTFSLGVLAASNQAAESNGPTPSSLATPSNRSTPPRQVNEPNPTPTVENDGTISPIQTPRRQAAPPVSKDLEDPLIGLTKALTKLIEKQSEPESTSTKVVDFLSKLAVLIATILGCYLSYLGIRKVPWFKTHQQFFALILIAAVLIVLFYLLSGLVTSVLYVLIAILILLVALMLAGAHLITFIDEKYPDVRDSILAQFSESSTGRSAQKLVRDNVRNMFEFLSNIVFVQRVNGDTRLTLAGSFVEGFDTSIFELEADDRVLPHWEVINDWMLIPVMTNLRVVNSSTGSTGQVVNVQLGLVVVNIEGNLKFKNFSNDGLKLLGTALPELNEDKMKSLLENHQNLAAHAVLFDSHL